MPILKSEIVSLLVGIQQNLLNSKAQILAEIQKSHSISTYHDLKDKTESCCTSEKTSESEPPPRDTRPMDPPVEPSEIQITNNIIGSGQFADANGEDLLLP
eukprot:TRINITY_DN2635_c0_g1_i8.p1 TRINITY_DN2635_c0_g1~~TRINITY_DN2635_c0_g1_i8.p1  ORF type:complete len:101 (-),score=14.86 TRINITY_DN2635_c0_g1_i8:287-589(-)